MKNRAMTMKIACLCTGLLFSCAALAAEPAPPKFTAKPAATKIGVKVKIEFAVDRETDVAVFVEDAQGKVVRHLVAGVLGANAPAPLKPGLAQSVEWDGKADYGQPAGPAPFRVRVALGMGAKYDKVLLDGTRASTGKRCVGVGPDGTLYVEKDSNTFGGTGIVALDRSGAYLRTVMPFPSNLTADKVKGLETIELDGRPAPLPHNLVMGLYPGPVWGARKYQMAIAGDGTFYFVGGRPGKYNRCALSSGALRGDGGCPDDNLAVPLKLPAGLDRVSAGNDFMGLALSGDEKSLYACGLEGRKGPLPVVFRIALPERSVLTTFFGDPAAPGSSAAQLGASPRGLAVDGKGHLLIADQDNNRIAVVGEADGKHVADVAVPKPNFIAVDRSTGCIYLTSVTGKGVYELQKLSGWKDAKVVCRMAMKWEGNPSSPPAMALDPGAKPPLVWVQEDYGRLLRVEDLGDKFGDARLVSEKENSATGFLDVNVDRFRSEVYMRSCGREVGSTYSWYRYDEAAEKMGEVKVGPVTSSAGSQLVPAPDGSLYAAAYQCGIFKFTRDGKPAAWASPIRATSGADAALAGNKMAHCTFMYVSEGWMLHMLGVRQDGHVFAFQPGRNGNRPPRMLREYLPTGALAREEPVIWKVSDGSIGPKFDPQGNIYVAEVVKPVDQPYPPEFVKRLGKIEVGKQRPAGGGALDSVATIYGSIVKFTPKGGMVHIGGDNPYRGEAKLDASLKTEDYAYYENTMLRAVKVTGAEWVRLGCSQVYLAECTCDSTRFDVDEFGRVWYPDQGRFRIGVFDSSGNDLMHFGGYGNADSRGPESRDKALAEPDVAFAWLTGVGVTDKYVYTGDSLNRRLLRSRIVYAAEETCPVN